MTTGRKRALAKENVSQSWASWRQDKLEKNKSSGRIVDRSTARSRTSSPQQVPNLCLYIRGLWLQIIQLIQTPEERITTISTTTAKDPPRNRIHDNSRPRVFKSVTRHFVAKAIASQVLNHESYNDILLSVLPQRYDLTKALESLTIDRNRAFMLLDLAAICKAHVELSQQIMFGQEGRRRVKLEYNVGLNRDVVLLELLCRLKTQLRCSSNQDVEVAQEVLSKRLKEENNNRDTVVVVDHAGKSRKPNGYLKRIASFTNSFTVDGPEEVDRVHNTLHRKFPSIWSRGYVLRLPSDKTIWRELMVATRTAAHAHNSNLDGISIHLEYYLNDLDGLITFLLEACSCCKTCTEDTEGLEEQHEDYNKFRIDVTGLSTLTTPIQDFFQALLKIMPHVSLTVDVSHLLVAHAGALCTRIIGVKRTHDNGSDVVVHYYIDDGCYGSLQNGLPGFEFNPMPLTCAANDSNLIRSTVWGPTCDGLDRVCREVMLPPLDVNDWLVFPNLGCGGFGGGLGLGTAFNGFEPPDTAYCVLGYHGRKE